MATFSGCEIPNGGGGGSRRSSRPQSDVLRDAYDDLATGRFAVIADFEDPAHRQLFKIRGRADAAGQLATGASPERRTGQQCLKLTLASGQSLVANNDDVADWLLKRNWRDYNLLLMNVHSPRPELVLQITLTAGEGDLATEAKSWTPLRQGWNRIRLDLNEAGDYIALDDVRQIRWSLPNTPRPVELRIDDVLLTDNRQELFAGGSTDEGRLYVAREGRGINVGATGRFEIGFAHGQITRWYDLSGGSPKPLDRVGPGHMLTPTPVLVPASTEDESSVDGPMPPPLTPRGRSLAVKQRVVEANDVRVIVESTWQAASGPDEPRLATRPASLTWRYAIYPTGDIYTTVVCATDVQVPDGHRLGIALSMDANADTIAEVVKPTRHQGKLIAPNLNYGWITRSAGDTGLLAVMQDARLTPRMQVRRTPNGESVGLLAWGPGADTTPVRWHSLISIWPPGNCAGTRRLRAAQAYVRGGEFEFIVGRLGHDAPGDHDADGFDEESGAWTLVPEANRVQFRIAGSDRPVVNPVFQLNGVADREAWVYVDYLIHRDVARVAGNTLIFQLPGVIDEDRVIEIYLRRPGGTAPLDRGPTAALTR